MRDKEENSEWTNTSRNGNASSTARILIYTMNLYDSHVTLMWIAVKYTPYTANMPICVRTPLSKFSWIKSHKSISHSLTCSSLFAVHPFSSSFLLLLLWFFVVRGMCYSAEICMQLLLPESQFFLSLSATSNWNVLNKNANVRHVSMFGNVVVVGGGGGGGVSAEYSQPTRKFHRTTDRWINKLFLSSDKKSTHLNRITLLNKPLLRQIERIETWNAICRLLSVAAYLQIFAYM